MANRKDPVKESLRRRKGNFTSYLSGTGLDKLVEISPGVSLVRSEYDALAEITKQYGSTPEKFYSEEVSYDDFDAIFNHSPIQIENQHIIFLEFYKKNIAYLPESIRYLAELRELRVMDSPLRKLPEGMGYLSNLQTLQLDDCSLTSLPDSIGNLKNLEQIMASCNSLSRLPESMGELAKLRRLSIQANNLAYLPDSIGNLSNLTYLDFCDNHVRELPKSFGNLKKLEQLSMSCADASYLPESLPELGNLRYFTLCNWTKHGNIHSRGALDTIGRMKNLKSLGLLGLGITSLPYFVHDLNNLDNLSLNGNRLTTLPDWICDLSNLQYLDVSYNKITHLPALYALRNLKSFAVGGNPINPADVQCNSGVNIVVAFGVAGVSVRT